MIRVRPVRRDDAGACAQVLCDAFRDVSARHGFPSIFRTADDAAAILDLYERFPVIHGTVAERDGRVAGVAYLYEGDPIRAITLIGVDPREQGRGVGRRLMQSALERCRGARGVRLVQETYNVGAMAFYASLGFEVKEPLARVVGTPRRFEGSDRVRALTVDDLAGASDLYARVHGIGRSTELGDAIAHFRAFGFERDGQLAACTYVVFGASLEWAVAETEDDLRALLSGVAAALGGPIECALPTRAAPLLRWAFAQGFRVEKPLTLMARGEYHEPRGAWLPSGFY